MKNTIIAVIAVVVLVALGFLLLRGSSKKTTQSPSASSSQSSTNSSNSTANTITYENGAFSPNPLTVKSGDTVTIVNKSSDSIQMDSDPHPQHTDNTELNVGAVGPGESRTFTVTKVGTWKYHNHLASDEQATIIVQ